MTTPLSHFSSPSAFVDELRQVVEGKVEVPCTVYVNVCGSEWRVRNARRPTNRQKWDFAVWGPGGGAAARSLSSAEAMVRGWWAMMTTDGRASADSFSSSFSSTASSSFQSTHRHSSSASAAEGKCWEERQEEEEEAAMTMQRAWRYAEAMRAVEVTERLRKEANVMAREEAMQASSAASPSLLVSSRSDLAGRAMRELGWKMMGAGQATIMSPSLPLLRSRRPLPDGPVRMRFGGGGEAVGVPTGSVLSEAHARLLGVSATAEAMSHLLSGTGFAMDVHEVLVVAEAAEESPSFRHVCSIVGALYFACTEAGNPVSYFRLESLAWEEGGSQHEEARKKREEEAHEACALICEAGVEAGTMCAVGGYAPWAAGATGADADAMAVQHLILEGIALRTTSLPRLVGWYKGW